MQKTKFKSGFTIAELLISIAIAAMLLTAVAVAFNASATNYRENEEIFRTINAGRQALMRMTRQLRTAGYEFPPWLAVDPAVPAYQCHFWTSAGEELTYEFRNSSDPLYPNTLLLITNSDGQVYVLCENVTAMSFTKTLTDDSECKSVQISMTVASGDAQRTLSAAAVVRRNLN